MESSGRIYRLFDTKHVSDRFSKRELVLEVADNPKYPQMVLFEATGDRIDQLDRFREGDDVIVTFTLRGREWRAPNGETKYFNTLSVWKVDPARATHSDRRSSDSRREPPPENRTSPHAASGPPPAGVDDDIPF